MTTIGTSPPLDPEALAARAASNETLVRRFFACLEDKDLDGWQALWHADGVYQIPYDDPAATYEVPFERDKTVATVRGSDNIRALFTVIPRFVQRATLYDITVRQTLDPDEVYVEFQLAFLIEKTQYLYENRGIGRMRIVDGKVALFREYLDLAQRQKGWAGVFF